MYTCIFNHVICKCLYLFSYYYRGFQAYLNGAPNYNFPMYRQLVHEITQTFTKISQDIILITKQLEDDHSLTTIATIVTGIQNNEKDKLEKVCEAFAAAMNIFKEKYIFGTSFYYQFVLYPLYFDMCAHGFKRYM